MSWSRVQKTLAVICLGGMPFATVSSCDYGPGGGTFFLDREVDGAISPGWGHHHPDDVVIIEDVYYEEEYYEEDVYYEEDYWVDGYWYEDDFIVFKSR